MIGDEDEQPRPVRLVDPARGVRDDERAHAEPAEHADAEDRPVGVDPFVEVRPPAQDRHGDAVHVAEHEHARMADRRRDGPARDLGVRDLDPVLDLVGEPAEPAAQDHADPRLEVGLLADPLDGLVEQAGGHAEPSASRCS